MHNAFDELTRALGEARELNRALDNQASALANLLRGRLRHVSAYHLEALKKELRDFNMHTRQWKD